MLRYFVVVDGKARSLIPLAKEAEAVSFVA